METPYESDKISSKDINDYGFYGTLSAEQAAVDYIRNRLDQAFSDAIDLVSPTIAYDLNLLEPEETARAVKFGGLPRGIGRTALMSTINMHIPRILRFSQNASINSIKVKTIRYNPSNAYMELRVRPKGALIHQRRALVEIIKRSTGYDLWTLYTPSIHLGRILDLSISEDVANFFRQPIHTELSQLNLVEKRRRQ
ncbi:MAG: hypothetical protein ABSB12_03325 [Candidatus Saccharimonadales bacterium]|jgi:hypothetical protein